MTGKYAVLLLVPMSFATTLLDAADWGTLRGRFVYAGQPPERTNIGVTVDAEQIGEFVPDESLLVDTDNRGIANVVVYVVSKKKLAVHPDYSRSSDAQIDLSMRKGRFKPHVVLLRTSQTLVERRGDDLQYAVNYTFLKNQRG